LQFGTNGTKHTGHVIIQPGPGLSINNDGTVGTTSGGNELLITIPGSGGSGSGTQSIGKLSAMALPLTIGYSGGRIILNGVEYNVRSGTIHLTPSVTNGTIFVDGTGTVVQSSSWLFPPMTVPLAYYDTSASAVTAVRDARVFLNPV